MAAQRRAAAAVIAATLIGGLAACGGGAAQPARNPASPSAPATSSEGSKSADRSPHGVMLSAEQVLQTARRAKLSYQQTSTGASAGPSDTDSGDGALFWAPRTVMQLQRTTNGVTSGLIVLDTVAYQGGDAATAARLGGKHWEKSAEVTGPDGRIETPFAPLIDQLNPLEAVTGAAAAGDLQSLGEEKLNDSTVQHYQATLSVADYVAAQQPLLTATRQQGLTTALSQGGVQTLTLDLWLNDHDQLVKLQRTGQGAKGGLNETVLYSDYGGAFSVQAPDESDTQDAG
ncbi:hypothetical protein P3T36_005938 [Kitasatospora sp. MAP12-15]|uniref:hypothetical protein n=1 Tax=unclassified Kitasatospora TaxID=2633591 RepID=UPI0024754491|nr:hypothetical protein [Kitasatospora sp. MAP12-44]MDH6111034.1 hypothetical protein [Kitasatospora sp. MAP12-44]